MTTHTLGQIFNSFQLKLKCALIDWTRRARVRRELRERYIANQQHNTHAELAATIYLIVFVALLLFAIGRNAIASGSSAIVPPWLV